MNRYVGSVRLPENIYKPQNLRGSISLFRLDIAFCRFVEQRFEMIIDNERLSISIAIPQNHNNIPNSILLYCIRCFDSCYMEFLALFTKRDKIPFKDDVVNDLHDLLVNQASIKTLLVGKVKMKLKLKSPDKNIFKNSLD